MGHTKAPRIHSIQVALSVEPPAKIAPLEHIHYEKVYMKFTSSSQVAASALLVGLLVGCGGNGEGTSNTSSSGNASSPSTANCNYPDLITSDQRSKANSCGTQVSGAYGAADARLQALIQACQLGSKLAADADYAGPYTKLVKFAGDNASTLSCGSGNTGPNLPNPSNPSSQTFYNQCGKTSGNQKIGSCYGPVFENQGGCGDGSFTYFTQHASSSACITARDQWLK